MDTTTLNRRYQRYLLISLTVLLADLTVMLVRAASHTQFVA